MVFYLIGLGLDLDSISLKGKQILKKCDEIYLESYTVDFPYDIKELKYLGKIKPLKREQVEDESILKNAKIKNIALLVYGDSLSATTHIQLINRCIKDKIKFEIIHNSSILTAVAKTGLQLYKFGKTASMPAWQEDKGYKPDSFLEIVKDNQKIKAHTLLLIDIGLNVKDALSQLEESSKNKHVNLKKIIIFSQAGTEKSKIYYNTLDKLKARAKSIKLPYCIIIPSELHFIEQEALDLLREKS